MDPFSLHPSAGPTPEQYREQMIQEIVANAMLNRQEWSRKFLDPRRSINDECGYPNDPIGPYFYQELYEREAIANRAVEVFPKESWQTTPEVYEDEDSENVTEFEEAWDGLSSQLRGEDSWYYEEKGSVLWQYARRADEQCGIGSFGIILIGIDDGLPLSAPAAMWKDDGQKAKLLKVIKGDDGEDEEVDQDELEREGVDPSSVPSISDDGSNTDQGSFSDIYGADSNPYSKTGSKQYQKDKPVLATNFLDPVTKSVPTVKDLMGTDAQYTGVQFQPDTIPVRHKNERHKLLYLRVYPESLVQIVQYESDLTNPRHGQPVRYLVTLNDPREAHGGVGLPIASVYVHWTRIIHVVDNLKSSEVFGTPRLKPIVNNILNIRKIYGSAAEGFWKTCFTGLSLETHPQLGGDVVTDDNAIKDALEQYFNGLQRALITKGMTARPLGGSAADPRSQVEVQIEAICIQLGCPVRIFKGSERGELASGQDDSAWNDRIMMRQTDHLTPRVVVPMIDRFIALGVLPPPKKAKKDPLGSKPDKLLPSMAEDDATDSGSPGEMNGEFPATNRRRKTTYTTVDNHNAPSLHPILNAKGWKRKVRIVRKPVYNAETNTVVDKMIRQEVIEVQTKGGYRISWPDITSQSAMEKSQIAFAKTGAMAQYQSAGLEALIAPMDFLTEIMGFTEDKAKAIIEAAAQRQEEMAAAQPPPGMPGMGAPPGIEGAGGMPGADGGMGGMEGLPPEMAAMLGQDGGDGNPGEASPEDNNPTPSGSQPNPFSGKNGGVPKPPVPTGKPGNPLARFIRGGK